MKNLDPVRAQQRSAEVRRERTERARRSALEVLAEEVEKHAEELVQLLLEAARRGEWRVVGLMLDRVFGKPKESVSVETSAVDEHEAALRQLTPEQRRALLRAADDEDFPELAAAEG